MSDIVTKMLVDQEAREAANLKEMAVDSTPDYSPWQ